MRFKIWYSLVVIALFVRCDFVNFVKGEKADAVRIFKEKRNFIANVAFKGVLKNKKHCLECDDRGQYNLIIKLSYIHGKLNFWDKQYPPLYALSEDSVLELSVTEHLYNSSRINDSIFKENKSFNIKINKTPIPILSRDTNKWLPQ